MVENGYTSNSSSNSNSTMSSTTAAISLETKIYSKIVPPLPKKKIFAPTAILKKLTHGHHTFKVQKLTTFQPLNTDEITTLQPFLENSLQNWNNFPENYDNSPENGVNSHENFEKTEFPHLFDSKEFVDPRHIPKNSFQLIDPSFEIIDTSPENMVSEEMTTPSMTKNFENQVIKK